MIILAAPTDSVLVITGSAVPTGVHASWVDHVPGTATSHGTVIPGRTNTPIVTAGTTAVVPSPAGMNQRNVKLLTVLNTHATLSNLVTIQHTDGQNAITLWSSSLGPGESVVFDDNGFQSFTVTGQLKVTTGGGGGGSANCVFNQPQVNGLTAGTVPLAGLNLYPTPAPTVVLTFAIASPYAGTLQLTYVLQAGAPGLNAPSVIPSTALAGYYWQLIGISFNGDSCGLNVTDGQIYPMVTQTVGGVVVNSPANVGIAPPT